MPPKRSPSQEAAAKNRQTQHIFNYYKEKYGKVCLLDTMPHQQQQQQHQPQRQHQQQHQTVQLN